jgi:hypothetical protein
MGIAKREDHPLDLPPPAKSRDIAPVATGVRTGCGLGSGVFAKAGHQLIRICYRPPVSNKWKITQRQRSRARFHLYNLRASFALWPRLRVTMMKPEFTKCQGGTAVPMRDGVALHFGTWQGQQMAGEPKNPTGGGIFIALGAAAGVIVGRLYGQTSIGLVAGVALGLVIAAILWRRDQG